MELLEKINKKLNRVLMAIGGISVILVMLLAFSNVVLRIFKVPFSGTYELVGYLGAVIIALALGETQIRKDHVMVDVLTRNLPEKVIKIIDGFKYIASMLFFSFVAWQLILWGITRIKTGELSETLKIVYYPFVFCAAFGFIILSLALLVDFLLLFRKNTEARD
jgi:TRAP-type C4-dicarboxylate transport system permease small subunit